MLSSLMPPMRFPAIATRGVSRAGHPFTPGSAGFCLLVVRSLEVRVIRSKRDVRRLTEVVNRKLRGICNVAREEYVEKEKIKEIKAPSRGFDTKDRSDREPLAQETVAGELVRRYWLDEASGSLSIEEIKLRSPGGRDVSATEHEERSKPVLMPLGVALPQYVADFVLPAGFPDSVSGDYLRYMLWQFPTNVTGWICSTLVTSSLFKAVGVGIPGGFAAAATATIKWVSKDGLGALGLILIGGRFGGIFDEDPKQWRMYADFVGSAGSIFELCTPLAPDQFLLLGSLGYLFKAVAKGLKDPSFRVIQNHFAISENVGDISAKEEVWEVSAKLLGLGIAVFLLDYWNPDCKRGNINYKRAFLLVKSYLQGSKLPGYKECNGMENLLVWWQLMSPRIRVGCSLKDLLGYSRSAAEVKELLSIYSKEDYVLVLHPSAIHGMEARVLAKEGATNLTILRSLWQAHWLLLPHIAESKSLTGSEDSADTSIQAGTSAGSLDRGEQVVKLSRSLEAMDHHFDAFRKELTEAGWDLDKIILKFPINAPAIMLSKLAKG